MRRAIRLRMQSSKYRARPKYVDGIRFASTKEARRYSELKLLEQAGVIRCLVLQPRFPLHAWRMAAPIDDYGPWLRTSVAGAPAGEQVGEYRADFQYDDVASGRRVIEDVKGFKTALYRWKKKHVEGQYGIQIQEV